MEVGQHPPVHRAGIERKGGRRVNSLSLSSWARTSIFSCLWTFRTPNFLSYRFWDSYWVPRPSSRPSVLDRELYHLLSWFSGLLTGTNYSTGFPGSSAYRGQIMGLLASITVWANFCNKSLIYPIGAISLESTNTYVNRIFFTSWEVMWCSS